MPVIALNNRDHKKLRVSPPGKFDYLANAHMLPLVLQEAGHAGVEYPVVFVSKGDTGQLQLVALFGLAPGENLFVHDGQWHGLYMPAILHHIPFKIITDGMQPTNMILGIDTDSELVQESEGEMLFDDDGNETEYLRARKDLLGEYFEHERFTRNAISTLQDLDLFKSADVTVTARDQNIDIGGLLTIDEAKLNALPEEKFLEFRKRGLLPFIYAQMLSINQFHRLGRLKAAS
jgi:hypothetical protein